VIDFNALISRARAMFLLGVLAVTTVLGLAADALRDVWAGAALMLVAFVLSVVLFVGHLKINATPHTGIRPAGGAGTEFEVPDVLRSLLLLAGAMTVLFGSLVFSRRIGDLVRGDTAWLGDVGRWLPTLVIAGLLVAMWFTALRSGDVRLSPDGVLVRRALGSSFVPWDALTVDGVTVARHPLVRWRLMPPAVLLTPAHPHLVRRTGRPGSGLALGSADPDRLAGILRGYVAHPAARPAIGTAGELARITA
jgi:hypothetical protein